MLLAIFLIAAFNLISARVGADVLWNRMDIPTHHPSFIDLRGVLAGLDAARLGYDPLYVNPLDPYQRPVSYPRLWMILGATGIGAKDTTSLAWAVLIGYALSVFVVFKNYPPRTAAWMALIVFSPAALMAYKFANLDLAIFILIACALAVERCSFWLGFGLLELAAFLKLFPIVAFGYLLREDRRRLLVLLAAALIIFTIYLGITWQDTSWVLSHAPKGSLENYGVEVIGYRVYEITHSRNANLLATAPFYLLAYALLVAAAYLSSRFKSPADADDRHFLDAFRIGALIYLATFVQGNSFNYRLIFLVLTVPQLANWAQHRHDLSVAAGATLGLVVCCGWGMVLTQILPVNMAFALDETANWLLFLALSTLFLVSCPDWIRKEITAFFNRYRLKKPVAQWVSPEE